MCLYCKNQKAEGWLSSMAMLMDESVKSIHLIKMRGNRGTQRDQIMSLEPKRGLMISGLLG